MGMHWVWPLLMIFGGLMIVLASGLPVAFSFLLLNLVGVYILWGGLVGISQLSLSMYSAVASFTLLPIPMFVLMGEVIFQSGIGIHMIDTMDKWLGRLPGRLAFLTVGAGVLLSTLSGAAVASTAMLGSTLLPEMDRRGYKRTLSMGCIMGSGCIAPMIPPSSLAVIVGAIGEISVGGILIGAIMPGVAMALCYSLYIIGICLLKPSVAPSYAVRAASLRDSLVSTVRYVLPLGLIIFLVTGVILLGVATPEEAAVTGTVGSFILAAIYGRLNWEVVKKSFTEAIKVSGMILMIITGSIAFSQILASSGASRGLVAFVINLPLAPVVIIILMQVILLVLGGPMGPTSLIMVTMPIFMPIVDALGFDRVWFGVMTLLNVVLSEISPPLGSVMYVMKGIAPADVTMGEIYQAVLPFFFLCLMVMALMVVFPGLVLWLPGVLR